MQQLRRFAAPGRPNSVDERNLNKHTGGVEGFGIAEPRVLVRDSGKPHQQSARGEILS